MTDQQSKALQLANDNEICTLMWPENSIAHKIHQDTAAELRRLHAENQQLRAGMEAIGAGGVGPLIPAKVQHQLESSSDNELQSENGQLSTSSSTATAVWKTVPVVPTTRMVDAARSQSSFPAGVWRAMLDAAPQPPAVGPTQPSAAQKDAVFEASIDFIGTLTGMNPPPIEAAPPEIFKPFRDFTEQVCAIFFGLQPTSRAAAPQPPAVKESLTAQQPQGEQELCCESWSVNRIDDLGKIVDSSGRLIATVYGLQAEKIVACHNSYTRPQPRRKPLTESAIAALRVACRRQFNFVTMKEFSIITRAVERAHWIGGAA